MTFSIVSSAKLLTFGFKPLKNLAGVKLVLNANSPKNTSREYIGTDMTRSQAHSFIVASAVFPRSGHG